MLHGFLVSRGATTVEDLSLFSCSVGLNVGLDAVCIFIRMVIPTGVPSLHLSMARTCRVIGGIATDAYMHAMKKTGKVGRPLGAVVCGPSSELVASTVDKDLCRILPAPYHPGVERTVPFQYP
jgi:hypothetical protein